MEKVLVATRSSTFLHDRQATIYTSYVYYVCMYVCMYVCVYISGLYIYITTDINTHTYIHTPGALEAAGVRTPALSGQRVSYISSTPAKSWQILAKLIIGVVAVNYIFSVLYR